MNVNLLSERVKHDIVIRQLLDKQLIAEKLYRYARGLDRLDRDVLLSVGHPKASVEFSDLFRGTWPEFVDWLLSAHRNMLFNNHRITNMLISLDGDQAASETSGTATLLVAQSSGDVEERWVHSRYLDKWSRGAEDWQIVHRKTIRDFRRTNLISAADFKARYSYENAHERGCSDESYSLLRE